MARKKKSSWRGRVKADVDKQEAKRSSYGYLKLPKGISIYTPTPGKTENFDVIPYIVQDNKHPDISDGFPSEGDQWYKFPFKTHRDVGSDNDAIVCLKTFNKKCPICDHKKQRTKEGAEKEELKELAPKDRNLYLVIPKKHKKLDEEIHILDMSWWLFQTQLNDELREKEEYEIFPSLEEGYTLEVRWKEKSFNKGNPYAEAGRIDFDERKKPYKESILKETYDLSTLLNELTYDELHAKFFELDEEDSADESKPKKRKKKSTKKKKKKELDLTWEDLDDMGLPELLDVCNKIDMEPEEYVDTDEGDKLNIISLRTGIAKKLKIKIPKESNKKKPDKKEKEKCPYGFEFGVDTDAKKTKGKCDKCDLWDDCDEKKGG